MSGKQIHSIIEELNESNSLNHKMDVLKKHKGEKLLHRVLKMTYDKVAFTYGISLKKLVISEEEMGRGVLELSECLDAFEHRLNTREVTGNSAIDLLENILASSEDLETAQLLMKVINRDLRINLGRSSINKVLGALIVKPVYMRCGTFNEKTSKKFDFEGAFAQLKADGTYREFNVQQEVGVTSVSRQGEDYHYPLIDQALIETGLTGVFFGELTVYRDGKLLDRATGNGILKKHELPEDCTVVFDCWDIVPLAEYTAVKSKAKGSTPYYARWEIIKRLLPDHTHTPFGEGGSPIRAIECIEINTLSEALQFTAKKMNDGFEGSIIKERSAMFKDGTSTQQLKLKVVIQLEVRVTGFHEGTPGTVREETFGSMTYETDDGKIKGRVSGFTNDQLADYNSRREELIGKVMTVECNDITKGRDNDHHALSHPRFIEERPDRDTTDTLKSALRAKEMSLMVDEETKPAGDI